MNKFRDNAWRWKCGLPEKEPQQLDIESLRVTQWSEDFEELMKNRMVLGTFRYGDFRAPDAPKYDRIGSAIRRLNRYLETGNKEFLVDTANLCLIEFEKPNHRNAYFESIDDGEHVKPI